MRNEFEHAQIVCSGSHGNEVTVFDLEAAVPAITPRQDGSSHGIWIWKSTCFLPLLVSKNGKEKDREDCIGAFGSTPLLNSERAVEPTTPYTVSFVKILRNVLSTRGCLESFMDLLLHVQGAISKQDTQLRRAIPAEEPLLVTLRFLATGESLSSLHFQFRIGISTLSGIVADTCRALWDVLREEFIPTIIPTTEIWQETAAYFF
ncbi:uncharacterized protein [Ranitomeya imitator]|uniref:uncharacterized protein n=1 Tax=Ranitomeya imitator TaxID=111125 RepID=UPI0037E7ADE5